MFPYTQTWCNNDHVSFKKLSLQSFAALLRFKAKGSQRGRKGRRKVSVTRIITVVSFLFLWRNFEFSVCVHEFRFMLECSSFKCTHCFVSTFRSNLLLIFDSFCSCCFLIKHFLNIFSKRIVTWNPWWEHVALS